MANNPAKRAWSKDLVVARFTVEMPGGPRGTLADSAERLFFMQALLDSENTYVPSREALYALNISFANPAFVALMVGLLEKEAVTGVMMDHFLRRAALKEEVDDVDMYEEYDPLSEARANPRRRRQTKRIRRNPTVDKTVEDLRDAWTDSPLKDLP
jgi:hypothetical protein